MSKVNSFLPGDLNLHAGHFETKPTSLNKKKQRKYQTNLPLRFFSTALMLASFKKGESTDSKYENLSCWVNLARLIKASVFSFPIIMK